MTTMMEYVAEQARKIGADAAKAIEIGPVVLEAGAIRHVAPYLKEAGYKRAAIVADSRTYEVAGRQVEEAAAEAGVQAAVTLVQPNGLGDVIADEASLVQLILDIRTNGADVVVAAGSGTLHDIARFSAYSTGIPFVSVPTAPSVDGFNSKGAPVILRGDKKTIQSIGPAAIFADLDILTKAPSELVAAGFGDMLGKYTSLFDWTFGSLTDGEPYSAVVADMTRKALLQCVEHADDIAARTPEGIRLLTGALLESGFAMLLFGQSHPASGAEHHLSHYWEMEFLRTGRRQILHGAKVGVACAEISRLYRGLADEGKLPVAGERREDVLSAIRQIPDADTIRRLLRAVGGPSSVKELGVDEELLGRSLREAHRIRPNRRTLLRAMNEA